MIEKLTQEQIELQKEVRDEWIDIALYRQNFDKEELEAGVKWLYYVSNLKEPEVVYVDSPKNFSDKLTDSVGASVWDSVWTSVGTSVWDSVRASVRASVRTSVWDSVSWTALAYDSDDCSFIEYFRRIGVKIDKEEEWNKYIGFLKAGAFYCFFFEKKAFVMRRPISILQNERKQLHSTTQPALKWYDGTEEYYLNGVKFEKEWWTKVVNDEFTPEEIFVIDNLEHRRIAYEFMDKTKMKSLKDYKILDETTDRFNNPMKVISFTIKEIEEPLKYLNVFCPSTKREYFIGTNENTCNQAKAKSFGFDESEIEFINEW